MIKIKIKIDPNTNEVEMCGVIYDINEFQELVRSMRDALQQYGYYI